MFNHSSVVDGLFSALCMPANIATRAHQGTTCQGGAAATKTWMQHLACHLMARSTLGVPQAILFQLQGRSAQQHPDLAAVVMPPQLSRSPAGGRSATAGDLAPS